MSVLGRLWSLLTDQDGPELRAHSAKLDDHERRIDVLERRQEARAAFHRVADGGK
jgi:hypothetical protein